MMAREVGEAVYVQGRTTEQDGAAHVTVVHQEQHVAGPTTQQVVEIPTVQEVVEIQEIPEIQVVEKVVEVIQFIDEPVEQIVQSSWTSLRSPHRSVCSIALWSRSSTCRCPRPWKRWFMFQRSSRKSGSSTGTWNNWSKSQCR